VLGWRGFWLPLAGGMVWPVGSYCAFSASETIGIARAAGTWTPLNIIVAFVWGALLFGELDHFSGIRFVLIAVALAAILAMPLENSTRVVTCGSSRCQAARAYS
jgi:glucose uptake protein